MPEHLRAQLIHIDVDRRLGHEWDEWDGKPLPNRGDYDSSPVLFFGWSAAALAGFFAAAALALYLLGPRLALLHPSVPTVLRLALAIAAAPNSLWPDLGDLTWNIKAAAALTLAMIGVFVSLRKPWLISGVQACLALALAYLASQL